MQNASLAGSAASYHGPTGSAGSPLYDNAIVDAHLNACSISVSEEENVGVETELVLPVCAIDRRGAEKIDVNKMIERI